MINWEVVLWTCITLAVIMGVIVLIISLISSLNMRKQREKVGKIHTDLKIGSKVMFAGGIYGRIVGIEEQTVNVDIAKGTVITISRYAIQALED